MAGVVGLALGESREPRAEEPEAGLDNGVVQMALGDQERRSSSQPGTEEPELGLDDTRGLDGMEDDLAPSSATSSSASSKVRSLKTYWDGDWRSKRMRDEKEGEAQPEIKKEEAAAGSAAAGDEAREEAAAAERRLRLQQQVEGNFARITLPNGDTYDLPIRRGSCGPQCIDISGFYAKSGYCTYDPGFTSTGSCISSITFIDGPKGVLLHRGYRIEELAGNSDFEEVSYLLWYGELPSKAQKLAHTVQIAEHRMIHEKLIKFYNGFKSDAHPMAIMVGVVGALAAFYHDSLDITRTEHRQLAAYRLLAKIPTIAAIAFKTARGEPIVYPKTELNYAENLLYMMFAKPTQDYELNATVAEALQKFLILHADHEQNASTSTVRIAGSSYANPFACISSGIVTLWGPAHGGANEAVINMLKHIGSVDRIPMFLERAKDRKDPFRLMGFGHRVYKFYDPRAKIMKEMCHRVLTELGVEDPLLDLAMELEKAALADSYFKKRSLYPNVDFYSGIVLRAIGIPLSMFTVLFAVARTVGWVSNWKEMIEDSQQRIGRPRQLYRGAVERPYVPMEERPVGKDEVAKPKKAANVKVVKVSVATDK